MVRIFRFLFFAWAAAALAQQPCTIDTVAGGGRIPKGAGGPALGAELRRPREVRRGPDGLLYFADVEHHRIRRITQEGLIETVVGTGDIEAQGDGLPGRQASIGDVLSVEFGPDGTLHWLERDRGGSHYRIRRLRGGVVETVAGGRRADFSGDGGPAEDAGIYGSLDFAIGPDGSIYIAAQRVHRIRKIGPDGVIDTIAGSSDPRQIFPPPASAGDGGPALEASIPIPDQVLVAPDSTLYVRESGGDRVRRISPDGEIDTYLGFVSGSAGNVADGGSRAQQPVYQQRSNLEIDALGRLYFVAPGGIRRITLEDRFETVAPRRTPFFVDGEGRLFWISGNQVHAVQPDGGTTRLAGVDGESSLAGDGGPATEAFVAPRSLAAGPSGEVYFYDESAFRVRVVRDGVVESFAGTGEQEIPAEGAAADSSPILSVDALATGVDGSVYFGDGSHVIWRVDPEGILRRVAGLAFEECARGDSPGPACGDGGAARDASLGDIVALAVAEAGDVYVLHERRDPENRIERVVRRIAPDGTIATLEVDGPQGEPFHLALDVQDRPLIIRQSSGASPWRFENGVWSQVADLQAFLPARPLLASGPQGNLYIGYPTSLHRATPAGALQAIVPETVASGVLAGDGGPAEDARLGLVTDLAADAQGNVYLADLRARRIRRIARAQSCNAFQGRPLLARVLNAASVNPLLAPGTIFSIYGVDMGPDAFLVAAPDAAGRFPTELGGVRVLVDGVAVPLLFVSANQINAVLPLGLFDEPGVRPVSVDTLRPFSGLQVERDGGASATNVLRLFDAAPGLFDQGNGVAAAFNQDGSLHTMDNPAAPGSIVTLFGTGGGPTSPAGADGRIVAGPLQELDLEVSLTIGGEPAEILFAGSAPGLVQGVVQINALISPDQQGRGALPAIVTIEGLTSSSRTRVVVGDPE